MKKVIVKVGVAVLRVVGIACYGKKWIKGRHFENGGRAGYAWVWRRLWTQKILGFNRSVPWPCAPNITISNPKNLHFHVDDLNNFQSFGIYFQNIDAEITIGRGCYIAPNVGLITTNHDPMNPDNHLPGQPIVLGENCWIGMNAVILPGVVLGDNTTVGAGAVVTKSHPEGGCVLAGVPAKKILPKEPIATHS